MDSNRRQPQMNQPGNPPAQGQPSLKPPWWNPTGKMPGDPTLTLPLLAWSDVQFQRFQLSAAGVQQWTWNSPVFDLRPGLSVEYGRIQDAVPINHEGAYGMSVYLGLLIGEQSGTLLPAQTQFTAEYWEVGNALNASNANLFTLTQVNDVTEQLLDGGTAAAPPLGVSPFSFTPCVPGLRYWQFWFRLSSPDAVPITLPYFIQASLH